MTIDISLALTCNHFMSLPPLPALEMLDTLGRTASLRQTAEHLNLSQSAVSHKLKALEARLGFALTVPEGRGLRLTAEARRYVASIRPALAMLRAAQRDLGAARGALDVAVPSGLAATWLAHRLPDFLTQHPEITVTLRSLASTGIQPDCDVQIAFTEQPPDGAEALYTQTFFPVCSPQRVAGLRLDSLRPTDLLHLHRRSDWEAWLTRMGHPLELERNGHVFTGILAMYAAAEAGIGLCLGDALTCEAALRSGRLVRPFDGELQTRSSYWILPAPGGWTAPAAAFADWIRAAFAAEPAGRGDHL